MKYISFIFLFLTACQFHPLFGNHAVQGVCVAPVPEAAGYQLHQSLIQHFGETDSCQYTLIVQSPQFSLSDQSVSDKDFITMQRVHASSSYKLLNNKKEVVLQSSVYADGSSAVVTNPYATVVSVDNTTKNLTPILAEQIALHVAAYLDRNQKQ